jgi:hypothetical protein
MAITSLAEQIKGSYNIRFNYLDDTQPGVALKVVIEGEGSNEVYSNDNLTQNSEQLTTTITQAGSYFVKFYLYILDTWVIQETETVDVLEWQIDVNWYYVTGTGNGFQVTPETDYYYVPDGFQLNNQACPTSPLYPTQISYEAYDLVNGIWEGPTYNALFDLSTWDDETSILDDIKFTYQSVGWPVKIVTTVSNCNQQIIHDTYLDDEFLITSIEAINLHSENQIGGSYTIQFSYVFQDGLYPNLIITPENNAQSNIYLYKNDNLIASFLDVQPDQNFTYTFDEASKEDVAEYKVRYNTINPDYPSEVVNEEYTFIVGEYKPTFNLPQISCKQINEYGNIILNQLNFNCYSGDTDYHLLDPDPIFTPKIRYTLYYFNKDTYAWDQQLQVNTTGLDDDAIDYYNEDSSRTDFEISQYLQNKYYFGSPDVQLWAPNKLTMVKLLVEVTNYTTTVAKETVFPICGSWKLRRMSCGNYRLYNYTANTENFTYLNLKTNTLLAPIQVPPFSFTNFTIPEDGVYKITGSGTSRYIFNFCSIEGCILELQKKVLLDDTLCDACKLDKVLYQKALRLIPIYETWKKLLDKDWVYDIQYQSTDIDGSLAAIYDADELYAELKLLCEECTNGSGNKKCNC